jgi:hypothetical protein
MTKSDAALLLDSGVGYRVESWDDASSSNYYICPRFGHVMVSSICPVCAVAHWDVRVEHCRPFASYQLVDISGVVLKLKCPSCAVNGVESLNSILHCVEMVILSHRF